MLRSLLLVVAFSLGVASLNAQTAQQIIDKMLQTIDNTKTYQYITKVKERFKDKYEDKTVFFKVSLNPLKVYLKDEDGAEVLFIQGWNDNKAFIKPPGFPYVNVSLSPFSGQMKDKQHHTILESGMAYTGSVVRGMLNKVKNENRNFNDHFKLIGEKDFNGKKCWEVHMINDLFTYESVTLSKNETPRALGLKNFVCEYMIEEVNGIGHGVIKSGKTIKIPNSYAKKVIFYIDKSNNMPIGQWIYDDKGLFEQYEYVDLQLNVNFGDMDFNEHNKGYGFH